MIIDCTDQMLFFPEKRPWLENILKFLLFSICFIHYLLPSIIVHRSVLFLFHLYQLISLKHLQKLGFKNFQLLLFSRSRLNHKTSFRVNFSLLQFFYLENPLLFFGSTSRFVLKNTMKRMRSNLLLWTWGNSFNMSENIFRWFWVTRWLSFDQSYDVLN